MNNQRKNRMVGMIAGGVAIAMVGMAFASVPLYRLFCQVTGFGGTPQLASVEDVKIGDRVVTVRFTADTQRGMPWRFKPVQKKIALKVGEQKLAFYHAVNTSDRTITGTATFNVTPVKAGYYFTKVDCFCFTEQTLAPGQEVDMPVAFYVDPDIAADPNMDDVREITLSYTFFPAKTEINKAEKKIEVSGKTTPNEFGTKGAKPKMVN
jgi:cytochrome c oxidase assembly protein subunit 11